MQYIKWTNNNWISYTELYALTNQTQWSTIVAHRRQRFLDIYPDFLTAHHCTSKTCPYWSATTHQEATRKTRNNPAWNNKKSAERYHYYQLQRSNKPSKGSWWVAEDNHWACQLRRDSTIFWSPYFVLFNKYWVNLTFVFIWERNIFMPDFTFFASFFHRSRTINILIKRNRNSIASCALIALINDFHKLSFKIHCSCWYDWE